MATVAATRARRLISAVAPPFGQDATAAVLTEQAHQAAGTADPVSDADKGAALVADRRHQEATDSRFSPSNAESTSRHWTH